MPESDEFRWPTVRVLLWVIAFLLVYCLYLNSSLHYERDQLGFQWAQQASNVLMAETNEQMSRWQKQAKAYHDEVQALHKDSLVLQRYRCP